MVVAALAGDRRVVFFIAGLAELRRPPFDMPIADSEIIMGPMTEYTGMRFALFMLAEYAGIIVISALTSVLFLGGWHGPFLPGPGGCSSRCSSWCSWSSGSG